MKLQMSTQTWESFAGGGGTVFSAADGLVGSSVRFPSGGFTVHPLGFDGNNVLAAKYNLSGTTAVDSFMKLYQVYPTSNGRQTHLAGVSGNVGSFCADGTNTSSCELPIASTYYSGGNLYDSANSRWMLMVSGSNRIRTLTPGGTVTTLLLLPNNASSFAYRNSPSPMIFYCSTSDGKLHKHDLTTDTTLAWPISSMSCAGKSMVYDSTNNVITFIFMQNGMYGIAQYINP
jgi:hypothetical protein